MSWFAEFSTKTFRKCQNALKGLGGPFVVWVGCDPRRGPQNNLHWPQRGFWKKNPGLISATVQIIPLLPLWPMAVRGNQLSSVATIWASSRLFPKWSFLWCQLPKPTHWLPQTIRQELPRPLAIRFITGARITARDQNSQIFSLLSLDPGAFRDGKLLDEYSTHTLWQGPHHRQCRPAEGPLGNKAIN